ncbi:chemotaxis protein CheB [Fundidesulfovibrio terrae]|uniref:chemotaxis protein CheB n=1 Tax=Fundidesulfovibrio terrae TaxID=2922866 RepID=UPI001FAF3ABA|nr:chemotaxis protein CheB [Fundidesulfovibrio terrae]
MSDKNTGGEPESRTPGVKGERRRSRHSFRGAESQPQTATLGFPVVAIGASAGGLEAIESFLRNTPADTGMAFVIIQHFAPDHKSIMPEILGRFTPMEVHEVADGMRVEQNHVYVIPPGTSMFIEKGVLGLKSLDKSAGARMPIDRFFESLAVDQKENAVCILMSGAGTDGTLSLKTVKAMGGITLAQDAGAKFKDMPRSAISSGLVDFVLLAGDMPAKLLALAHARPAHPPEGEAGTGSARDHTGEGGRKALLGRIFQLVRLKTGHDFSQYKFSTILRRIERRMVLHHIGSLEEYVGFLVQQAGEVQTLFEEFLIGVTGFFRDPEAFEVLARQVVPRILAGKTEANPVRIWVPGCSTGEEAYSLAIIMAEALQRAAKPVRVQIFCTDIDSKALEGARKGIFPGSITESVSPERLKRFFEPEGTKSYRVTKEIRDMLVIAPHSVIKDPPFSKLDLISCRNLLIYLGQDVQKLLIPCFNYSLKPGGFLFVGPSESLGEFGRFFTSVDSKWKIFQRNDVIPEGAMEFSLFPLDRASFARTPGPVDGALDRGKLLSHTERLLLEEYAPPSVVVDTQYEALHFYGKLGKFLELSGGEPTRSILKLAREDIRLDLRAAIHAAIKDRGLVKRTGLSFRLGGAVCKYSLVVRPVTGAGQDEMLLIVVFQEVPGPDETCPEPRPMPVGEDISVAKNLEEELLNTRERLHATIEELEASNEELKSTNEELMSMNEELQSSNEELESSREELQSLNEELNTVNQELQYKIDEVTKVNSDLNNLLTSTKIATLFLDQGLTIKRFTPPITEFFNLFDFDIGRSIGDIAHKMDYDELIADIQTVINTLIPFEREVKSRSGNWYIMRITPYRTVNNMIDGTVITFVDVTLLKGIQQSLYSKTIELETLLQTVPDTYFRLDHDLNVIEFKAGRGVLPVAAGNPVGKQIAAALPRQAVSVIETAAKGLGQGGALIQTDFSLRIKGTKYYFEARLLPIPTGEMLIIIRDMTDLKRAEERALKAKLVAEKASKAKTEFLANMSHEIRTPLNGIVGLTELALAKVTGEQERTYLLGVKESLRSLQAIINDILDFSKIEAGRLKLNEVPFDLKHILFAALEPFQLEAQRKGIELSLDIAPDVPLALMGDDLRLKQVLSNLVGNAVKFTEEGGVSVRVEQAAGFPEPEDEGFDLLRFMVSDTGIGISEDKHEAIFDKFVQGDVSTVKAFSGTGLGLPICKSLVEMMQGSIWVESEPGSGSVFQFIVPLRRQEKGEAAPETERDKPAPQAPMAPLKILLAEDNAINQLVAAEFLKHLGHVVTVVGDGVEALQTLQENPHDVLIVDVSMPRMDGYEVIARIRGGTEGIDPAIPIVALTAYAMDEDRKSLLKAGASAFLAKPLNSDDLANVLAIVRPEITRADG